MTEFVEKHKKWVVRSKNEQYGHNGDNVLCNDVIIWKNIYQVTLLHF